MQAHDLLIYMRFPDITGIADDIIMAKKVSSILFIDLWL